MVGAKLTWVWGGCNLLDVCIMLSAVLAGKSIGYNYVWIHNWIETRHPALLYFKCSRPGGTSGCGIITVPRLSLNPLPGSTSPQHFLGNLVVGLHLLTSGS